MHVHSRVSIPPESVSFRQVQPDVYPEAHHWRAAMDDKMNSMAHFEVYKRVSKSDMPLIVINFWDES